VIKLEWNVSGAFDAIIYEGQIILMGHSGLHSSMKTIFDVDKYDKIRDWIDKQ